MLKILPKYVSGLLFSQVNVEHMDRFSDEFGSDAAEDADENDALSKKTSKPSDFRALFGGNNDDHFMIGIKFTR